MRFVVLSTLLALAAALPLPPAIGQPARPAAQPEDSTGRGTHALARAGHHMIVAAHPAASQAGIEALRRGGSAVDAAIAAQMVLNLVEPQSSGIGGGAFMLRYDADSGRIDAFDGRERAPAAAGPDLFVRADGTGMTFAEAVVGGRSVGTPGLLRMLALAHREHGRLAWAELFGPAIALAREGFTVGPRLAAMLRGPRGERLRTYPAARAYFFPGGRPLAAGERRDNPALADTLERIALEGPDAFYTGEIARDIVAAVRGAPGNPGLLDESDLAGYAAQTRAPVCVPYRLVEICGMGPPSSGGVAVGQILGLLSHFDMAALGADDPRGWHLLAEASKLAFADRDRFLADADFVAVPAAGLLDPAYLAARSRLIDPGAAAPTPVAAGDPPGSGDPDPPPDGMRGRPGTTHVVVVDGQGNAVSMTSSIEGAFGSQLLVRGFLLNNQLTDFAFLPVRDGRPLANRVEGGKRPRSSMAPTIVRTRDGALRLALGASGGSRIVGYVAQRLVAILDWGLDVQTAIDLGHVVNRNDATELERGTAAEALAAPLERLGHAVVLRDLNSGLHAIEVVPGGLEGGADPRREGLALGD